MHLTSATRVRGFAGGFFALYIRRPGARSDGDPVRLRSPGRSRLTRQRASRGAVRPAVLAARAARDQRHFREGEINDRAHGGCGTIAPDLSNLSSGTTAGSVDRPRLVAPERLRGRVPFRFPSPAPHRAWTHRGRPRARRACTGLGSSSTSPHLNERGSRRRRAFERAFVATTRTRTPSARPRQPHRQQLAAIRELDGIVGSTSGHFLRGDGLLLPAETGLRDRGPHRHLSSRWDRPFGSGRLQGPCCPTRWRASRAAVLVDALRAGRVRRAGDRRSPRNWLRVPACDLAYTRAAPKVGARSNLINTTSSWFSTCRC